MIIIVILIIAFAAWLIIKHFFRKKKDTPLILFSGANGSGKSFNMTDQAKRFYRKSLRKWKRVNKPFLTKPLYLIPYFDKKRKNKEIYGLNEPQLYSTYPIKIGKNKLSTILTNDLMFLEKSFPLNSIVVIDEFSGWINQFEFKENFSVTLNDHLQKWRHYHGNDSHLLMADQCTNNIPIQVRYRCNRAFVCQDTKHYLGFIHITHYKYIELTDDIKSVEIIDDEHADTDDKTLRIITLKFGRDYDDRAYSNRYHYVDQNGFNSKYIDSPMKVNQTLLRPDKNRKDYVDLDMVILNENKAPTN